MGYIKSFLKLLLVLFVGLCQMAHAQERQKFSGPIKVAGFEGQADYSYIVRDTDTILDGVFRMHRSNVNALLQNTDAFFSFNGSFTEGYPEGKWMFQFGEFQSENGTEVVGYQYRVKVSGTQHEAQGDIIQGKPDGAWMYTVNEIENSEVSKTVFASTIEFDNGIPQKSFRIENEHHSLVGRFLRNGLAHDEWSLYSDEDPNTSESWFFNEGTLEKTISSSADGKIIERNFWSSSGNTRIINLDKNFIHLMKIQQQESDSSNADKKGIRQLLADNMAHYDDLNAFLSALGNAEFTPGFKVKVTHFPLDSTENNQLQSIASRYTEVAKTSQSLLENTQLNILRRSDEEAQFLYMVIAKISETFLSPVGKLTDYRNQGILEYVSRKQLFKNLWPDGTPSKTITISGETGERNYVGPKSEEFDFSKETIADLHQLTEYAAISIESIAEILNRKLAKDSKQQEFIALEEQMIAHSNHIGQVVDSVKQGLPRLERLALNSIQELAEAQLEQYATMENEKAKSDFGLKVIECLKQLDGLTNAIAQLSMRWETIEEKYRDDIWNPFMATIMNEEVKKRVTGAYRNVLMPYLLNGVGSNLSCENAEEYKNLFENSYQRMLEIRDENTAKLERKLKKEQDPKIVLQLFNLKSSEIE